MAKCIYTKLTENDTKFEKREHVFPAGIGGSKMLPKGAVSDYANEVFSKLELSFMRDSIISIPRVFHGPGKRGSLSHKKRTKSKISLMKSQGSIFFGYTELAIPKTITQFQINYDDIIANKKQDLKMSFPPDKDIIKSYEALMNKITGSRYVKVIDSDLDINHFIVGNHEKNLFIACNKNSNIEVFHNYLKNDFKIPEKIIRSSVGKGGLKVMKSKPNVTLNLSFDINDYCRVCAKVAFNALCYLKGSEFVLTNSFDEVRNFIMNGDGEFGKFVQLPQKKLIEETKELLEINELNHSVIFSNTRENQLCAILTLYGIDHLILLSANYSSDPITVDGFICDWEKKNETTLSEKLKLTNSTCIEF